MQSTIQYHHHLHSHDGTFHLNNRERVLGTSALKWQKGDHWQCSVSAPLNELLTGICSSWLYTNRPIVTSRPMVWPLISRIDMSDGTTFDMMNANSMEQLRDYVHKQGTASCFGIIHEASGSADKYDERIRQSVELNSQQVTRIRDTDLCKVVTRLLRSYWGLGNKCIKLNFYKLLMYDTEGHFEFHRDAVHDECHVGTLVISLESPDCRGGRVVFKDFDDDILCTDGEYRMEDTLKMCMFYTDAEHRVEPVTQGYRILLQYEILVKKPSEIEAAVEKDKFHYDTDVTGLFDGKFELGNDDDEEPPSPITLRSIDLFFEQEFDEQCANNIVTWLKNASVIRIPGLMMSNLYPIANIEPATLRGFDRLLYKILDPHFDIEFMPVCLYADGADSNNLSRCVSLHRNRNHHEKRELTLYVTPARVHCTNSLEGAYMGGNDRPAPHLNYVAVVMILNKITSF
jgi:hypothetical protein